MVKNVLKKNVIAIAFIFIFMLFGITNVSAAPATEEINTRGGKNHKVVCTGVNFDVDCTNPAALNDDNSRTILGGAENDTITITPKNDQLITSVKLTLGHVEGNSVYNDAYLTTSSGTIGTFDTTKNTILVSDINDYTVTFGATQNKVIKIKSITVYYLNTYSVTLHVNEGTINNGNIERYVQSIGATLPTDLTRTGYTFVGWYNNSGYTGDIITSIGTAETGNKEYWAKWDINSYQVIFKNADGTILQSSSVEYGSTPSYVGAAPTKDATAQYTYTFAGWDKEITSVTGDITYTAIYESEVNKYKVTFVNEDETVLSTSDIEYGQTPSYEGETPTKDATDKYTYTFIGWDKEITSVTGDVTYTATYKSEAIPGEMKKQDSDNNANNAELNNTVDELMEMINLTNEEKNTISNGSNIYVLLEVNDISDSVSKTDKELVETKLSNNSKVGIYLDINVYKQLDNAAKIKVEETSGNIKVSFEIPENLRSVNRTFYIVRVHNGEVTKITPTINGNILTFETDKFSTYALAYTDPVTAQSTNNPQTLDNILLYVLMLGLSSFSFTGTALYMIKNN